MKKLPFIFAAVFAVFAYGADLSDQVAEFPDEMYSTGLPTYRNVPYGGHIRQKLDVWIPEGVGEGERLPCVVVIHGGAWVEGERPKNSVGWVVRGRKHRLIVAGISYRMVPGCKRAGIVPPVAGPLEDAVAAIRFLKDNAEKYRIDVTKIGLTGGSAGACSSLYASLQADNSLGIKAISVSGAQTTFDPLEISKWVPGGFYGSHGFGYGYHDIKSFTRDREKWLPYIKKYSPAELLRNVTPQRAPKIFYSSNNIKAPYGQKEKDPVHSGYYMNEFKKICLEKNVFCEPGTADAFIDALKSDFKDDPFDYIRGRLLARDKKIVLPRGIYNVSPRGEDKRMYLKLRAVKDVTIDFNGSKIICNKKTRLIDMQSCTNVTVKNFTVDFYPLTFTQGLIEKVDADKNWDVRILPGYPSPEQDELDRGVWPVQVYAKEDLELKNPNRYRDGIKVIKTGKDMYRVQGGVDRRGDVGDVCVWSLNGTEPRLKTVVHSEHCYGCRYENIVAYATPGGCLFAELYSHGATYLKCRLERCPFGGGSSSHDIARRIKRVRSGNHDAFNARFGDTVTVDGCEFSYHCDDCINISGYYSVVVKCEGNKIRVIPAFGRKGLFHPGDTIQIMTFEGEVPPDAKVLKVEEAPDPTKEERDRIYSTKLREPLMKSVKTALTLTLDREVDFSFGTVVISNERMGNGFAIRNCKLGSTRARGMLIKASDGVIENNIVERSNYDAISIYPEYEWLEGGCSRNVIIRNNKLRNNGGGIWIGGKSGNGTRLSKEAHLGMVLENNEIIERNSK